MPPPSYPAAQISAAVDRSSPSPLRAALDAYAAKPHLRSSPTFEFLHFAVVGSTMLAVRKRMTTQPRTRALRRVRASAGHS